MSMKGIGKYRIVALATMVVALAAALAGTVEARNNSPPTAGPATSNLASFQVQVRDFSYAPNTLTAAVNDPVTITVTNAGPSTADLHLEIVNQGPCAASGASEASSKISSRTRLRPARRRGTP